MKIGIVGNYGNNNNGDEAILLGIIQQLTTHFDVNRQDITVFSDNPDFTKQKYGTQAASLYYKKGSAVKTLLHTVKHNRKVMKGLDVVIIGGGGILMDLYKREAPLFGTYGLLGRFYGAKVIVYGCGVGPLNTSIGRLFIRLLTRAADSVSVRDPQSKELLRKIGVKKDIDVIGDPAFSITPERTHKSSEKVKKIGVTSLPYYNLKYWPEANDEKYEMYVNGMAQNLDALIKEKGVDITFFSTKFPQDVWMTQEIYNRMKYKDHATVIDEHLQPHQLINICAEQDVVIGTRLHSIIFSYLVETPSIGVAYHHKVEHFMKMIDQENACIPIDNLSSKDTIFLSSVNEMEQNWKQTETVVKKISVQLKEKAAQGLKQFHMLPRKEGKWHEEKSTCTK
ncbi:polysaccharide pyruvyl transferase family protein [Cytobacillus sp. Hm23]